jgi:dTDP-4-amino-4,6-dideoxygalactose transaminase
LPLITHAKVSESTKAIYLRYPVQADDPQKLFNRARKNGIILGKWYDKPIFPWIEISQKYYQMGSCPVAESVGKSIVNLPTYPRLQDKDVDRIIKVVKDIYGNN